MQRLDGMDASFVYLDTPAAPLQVGMICVFDPSTAPGGYSFAKVRRLVEDRLHLIPPFRRRLVEVPAHLHRPGWIEDPDFDLDQHLHQARLPAPGGMTELQQFAADVFGRPLDPGRPPWDMHIVDGLEGGVVASVTKMHHAAVDGVSGAELTATLLDLEAEPRPVAPPDAPWKPAPLPAPLAVAARAVRELLREPAAAASVLARTARAALRLLRHNREPETTPPPAPFAAPRCAYNAPLTGARHVSLARVALDDVRRIKDAAGVTINDVILAVCADAVRGHLAAHDGVPGQSLVAAVPVSVRTGDQSETSSNRLSAMLVELGTAIDDPIARLRAIAASSRAAKTQHHVLGPETFSQLADVTPSPVLATIGALGIPVQPARAHPTGVQPHRLELSRAAVPVVLRRGPHGRGLSDGPTRDRDRPQHHGAELPRHAVVRDRRLPGRRPRAVDSRRRHHACRPNAHEGAERPGRAASEAVREYQST